MFELRTLTNSIRKQKAGLLNYLLLSRSGGIWNRPRAPATCTENWLSWEVREIESVSAGRRWRRLNRLIGLWEWLGFSWVDDGNLGVMEAVAVQNLVIVNILAGHVLTNNHRIYINFILFLLHAVGLGHFKIKYYFSTSSHKFFFFLKTKLKRKSNSKNSWIN